jgi:hypothetical protein
MAGWNQAPGADYLIRKRHSGDKEPAYHLKNTPIRSSQALRFAL